MGRSQGPWPGWYVVLFVFVGLAVLAVALSLPRELPERAAHTADRSEQPTDDASRLGNAWRREAIQNMQFYRHEESGLCFGYLESMGRHSPAVASVPCNKVQNLLFESAEVAPKLGQ